MVKSKWGRYIWPALLVALALVASAFLPTVTQVNYEFRCAPAVGSDTSEGFTIPVHTFGRTSSGDWTLARDGQIIYFTQPAGWVCGVSNHVDA